MTKPTKPQWADGHPSYVIEPSGAKKLLGWLSGEKPPFQYANWLHYQTKEWIDWFESKIQSSDRLFLKSDSAKWDGGALVLEETLSFYFRNEAGDLRINRIAAGTLSFVADQALVIRLDRTSGSPVTLTLQTTYASLADGQYGIFNLSSLNLTNDDSEIVVLMRKDFTPPFHYGVNQQVLFDLVNGTKYYQESFFDFGSSVNKNLEGIYSQAILNGNCEVSQFGNFTTAVNSTGGVSNNRHMIDGWKFGGVSTSVYVTNATFQRTNVTISGDPRITKASKIVMNTSGAPISGFMSYGHVIGNSDYSKDFDLYKGKNITFEFWLRSNKASNVRAYIEDGVNNVYHELDTGSGDLVWRRYSVSLAVSASATALKFWLWVGDSSGGNVSIANLESVEITGGRVHIGTERLGALFLPYAEDLQRCRHRFYGAREGEKSFNAGYGIYNINGVTTATWRNTVAANELVVYSNNTDVGTQGLGMFNMPHEMISTAAIIPGVYLFDAGATTAGGANGVNPRITVLNAGGVATNNIVADVQIGKGQVLVNNSTLVTEGGIYAHLFVISNLI